MKDHNITTKRTPKGDTLEDLRRLREKTREYLQSLEKLSTLSSEIEKLSEETPYSLSPMIMSLTRTIHPNGVMRTSEWLISELTHEIGDAK